MSSLVLSYQQWSIAAAALVILMTLSLASASSPTKSPVKNPTRTPTTFGVSFVYFNWYEKQSCTGEINFQSGYRTNYCFPYSDGVHYNSFKYTCDAEGINFISYDSTDCTGEPFILNDEGCYDFNSIFCLQSSDIESIIVPDSALRFTYDSTTCDSTPISFKSWLMDYCFTSSSYGTSYNNSFYSSYKNRFTGISVMDNIFSSEVSGTFKTYTDWTCYNPNKMDDLYYYGAALASTKTTANSNQRNSRLLQDSSFIYACQPYTATNTSSEECSYTYEGDEPIIVTASTCSNYTGDTLIEAYVNDILMASNDDYCVRGSQVSVLVNSNDVLTIQEGCYDTYSCGGTVTLTSSNIIFACDAYTATNTNNDTTGYTVCTYTYTGTDPLFVSASTCFDYKGDTYIKAYINGDFVGYSDDFCGTGSEVTLLLETDDVLTIKEGCYGNTLCNGTVVLVEAANTSYSFKLTCDEGQPAVVYNNNSCSNIIAGDTLVSTCVFPPTPQPTSSDPVQLDVVQTITGCSFADYLNAPNKYDNTFKQAIVQSLQSASSITISIDDILDFQVQDATVRRKLLQTPTLAISYTLQSSSVSASTLTSALTEAVSSETFDNELHTVATENKVTGLTSAKSSNPIVTNTSPTSAPTVKSTYASTKSAKRNLSVGAIVGIVVAIIVLGSGSFILCRDYIKKSQGKAVTIESNTVNPLDHRIETYRVSKRISVTETEAAVSTAKITTRSV